MNKSFIIQSCKYEIQKGMQTTLSQPQYFKQPWQAPFIFANMHKIRHKCVLLFKNLAFYQIEALEQS